MLYDEMRYAINDIPLIAAYTNGKLSEIYTVVYLTGDVIAHIIRYDDMHKAVSDAVYWKYHTTVWISQIVIYKGDKIISVLTGRE